MDFGPELRLFREGTPITFENGVTLNLSPRDDNFAYQEAIEALRKEVRAQLNLEKDEALPMTAAISIGRDAVVGTVLHGWSGVEIDGEEIPDRTEDGELDEDAALRLVRIPSFFELVTEGAGRLNAQRKEEREAASGKSSPPSDGGSDTDPT